MPNILIRPRWLLQLEGAAVLAICIVAYLKLGMSGWLFLALLLVPDLGMLGYLGGPKLGAVTYNLLHTSALPLAFLAVSAYDNTDSFVPSLALIWLAHLGMDRMLGFGLKYPTAFKDTHFGRV